MSVFISVCWIGFDLVYYYILCISKSLFKLVDKKVILINILKLLRFVDLYVIVVCLKIKFVY